MLGSSCLLKRRELRVIEADCHLLHLCPDPCISNTQRGTHREAHTGRHTQGDTCRETHTRRHMQRGIHREAHAVRHIQRGTHSETHTEQHTETFTQSSTQRRSHRDRHTEALRNTRGATDSQYLRRSYAASREIDLSETATGALAPH
eukprot:COSAG03_NODE_6250_length_1090_cov_1.307770_2_plen_147_part_00